MRIQALGGYRIFVDGRDLRLRTRKEALLLLRLALGNAEGVSRDVCIGLLWPESSEARARHSLSEALRGIEMATQLEVVRSPERLSLPTAAMSVDVHELEDAIARGDVHRCAELYKGGFLAGWYPPTAEASHWVDGLAASIAFRLEKALRKELAQRRQATDGHGVAVAVGLLDVLGVASDDDREAAAEAEQLIAWEFLRPGESVHSRIGGEREGPFVGRVEEMKILTRELERAMSGEVRVVLVSGEPGIGKTRTCQRLARLAALRGARLFLSTCYELEQSVAYGAISEAFGGSVRTTDVVALQPVWRESLGGLLPELGPFQIAADPSPDPEHGQRRLLHAVTALIESMCRNRPGLLLVDDLQWADSASCLLLHHLRRKAAPAAGLLLVVATRPLTDEVNPAAAALLRQLAATSIELGCMSVADTITHVAALISPVPRARLSRIARRSQGNPLFARELALGDEAAFEDAPPTIRDVVLGRIRQLPAEEYGILAVLAVSGGRSTLEALSRVLCTDPTHLLQPVSVLIAQRLIKEDGSAIRIEHDLVRASIYSALGDPVRQTLHAAVGRADSNLSASARARHFEAACLKQEATGAALEAANDARLRYAQTERLDLLECALRNASEPERPPILEEFSAACLESGQYRRLLLATAADKDLSPVVEIRTDLARLKRASLGSYDGANEAIAAIDRLLVRSEIECPADFVEIAREKLRYAHEANDADSVLSGIQQLVAFARHQPGTVIAAHALTVAAYQQAYYMPGAGAEDGFREALQIGRAERDPSVLVRALLGFAICGSIKGSTTEMVRYGREARTIARRHGMEAEELRAHAVLASAELDGLRFERALTRANAVVRRADTADAWNTAMISRLTATTAWLEQGADDRAAAAATEVLELERTHPDWFGRMSANALLGLASLSRGDPSQAEACADIIEEAIPGLPTWMDDPIYVLQLVTEIALRRGRSDDAIDLAESVARGCKERNRLGYWNATIVASRLKHRQRGPIDFQFLEEIQQASRELGNRLVARRCDEILPAEAAGSR